MRLRWNARINRIAHGVVVRQGWCLCPLRRTHVLLRGVRSTRSHRGIADTLSSLVRGMIKKSTNVMNEKRVQEFCDLLLVREVQRAIEWDPVSVSPPNTRSNVGSTYQTPFRCIGPILTT